jgi:hypothetical protein
MNGALTEKRETMEKKIPLQVLENIFDTLSETNLRSGKSTSDQLANEIVVSGWTFPWQLEDLLLETDSRIHRMDIESLATYFDIPLRYVFHKPRFVNAGAVGHEGLSATDAACLLMKLEDIGFDTNPMPFVRGIAPGLANAKYVDESELSIISYEWQRHRCHTVLRSDADIDDGEWETKKVKDAVGRRFEFTRVGGKAYMLEVKGPKYRRQPNRRLVTCDYCDYRYTKGDPESNLAHRSEHARVRKILDPKPLPAFSRRLLTKPNPELVDASSPKWMHGEMYERACRFKRELKFDFIQWEGNQERKNISAQSQGYLFSDHTSPHMPETIVGACAFWKDADQWRLRWVWVCPKMRRKGVLAHRWRQFLERYGDFEIETPLSEEMRHFVLMHGSPQQCAAVPPPVPT